MKHLDHLKLKLHSRENILSTTIANVAWSGIIQRINGKMLDFVVLDLEHGTLNIESIEELLRVARLVDLPTIVRVPDILPHLISKTIDMGADGIIIPRVESLEQVDLAVKSLRFAPIGRKGCGGFSLFRPGEQFEEINGNRLLFIQIESDEGIACLPDILGKHEKEIAGVLIGPYDMSIMAGVALQTKCDGMMNRIRNVFETSKSHGKSCGIFVDGASDMQMWKEAGANIFWTGTEMSLYGNALNDLGNAFQKL